uniref:TFIIB-type domain-containing protein n=2 Tax=Schistosoma mansoni TaxID=6183 RepID=A0A3Q0KRX4_SCHMA
MSCPICENRELVEDENTGQLICSECGTATGVYRGVTQSQDFSETRGLRVIQKTEHIVSQSNQAATDNIADTSRFVKVEPDSTHDQNMNSVCREDLLNTLDDDLFSGSEVSFINPTQKEKCFERHRPWRLSEPFTFIMRRQANCLAKELNLSVEQKVSFCDTVWSIWLHYLSITGELGSDAWVNAALLLAKSISEVLESKMIPEEERPTNKILRKHKTSNHCYMTTQREHEWELMQTRLNQFQWVGWGLLYEPEEGREIAKILHLSRKKKAPKQVDKSEKSKRRGRKRKNCSESDSSELVLSDENPDDDAQSVHSPAYDDRRDLSNPDVHDSDLSFQPKAVESELFPDNDCTQEMPLSYFTKKLSRLRSMGHLFWRGQIEGGFNCRVLMEYNVAILFIACLTTCPIRKAVNPLFSSHFINSDFSNSPCALTTMITLKDLQDLCNNRRLPFISVQSLFPPGAFCIRDQSLLSLIRRHRPPEINHLAYATARMREFIGLNHFPKYPLSWLMHRHITALGLPVVMHEFVRPLLERLQKECIPVDKDIYHSLLSSTPWPRVVRPEVFAMALVVILLRLVFKFDDTFEHRLSSVAKALELFPNRPVKSGQTSDVSLYDRPFIWISWVQYINSRFHPSHKLNLNSFKIDQNPYSNARVRESSRPLVMTASQGSELLNLDKASDFLGSTEFKIGRDIGWGEESMKKIKIADASVKLSLSQPLRNLFEPYQVNCLTESTVSTQSHCTHRHQMVIDDLTSDSSTNGKKNTFYKCLIPSDYEQDGLLSPFLNTQLNFLYNKGINVNDYIPNAFNDHQTSTDSYGFNDCTIREWWLDLINQRSDYFSICIGEWSSNSSSKSQWKNRHRSKQPLILPKPVEEFIAKHDESLSKALGHDHDELVHAKQNDKDDSQKGESNGPNAPQSSKAKKPVCLHCSDPSQSMKWLVDICAMICGASNIRSLLTEIECLERLLKWHAKASCSPSISGNDPRQVDYALLSFFDLNVDICEVSGDL